MTVISNGRTGGTYAIAGKLGEWHRRIGFGTAVWQRLRLWRARHRHRQELAMMSAGDMKDARLAHDVIAHELRKWPWQKFHPQWQEMDDVLLRGIAVRRRQPERECRMVPIFLPPKE